MSDLAPASDFPPWRQSVTFSPRPSPRHVESRSVEDQVRRLIIASGDIAWAGDRTKSLAARDEAKRALEAALGSEKVDFIRDAIREAIEEC